MIVGTLTVHIPLHGIGSLKDKRRIVKSLIGRLQSRFNFSVSEVDAQDNHRLAVIGLAVVGGDGAFIERQLDTVLHFIRGDARVTIGHVDREMFSCGDP